MFRLKALAVPLVMVLLSAGIAGCSNTTGDRAQAAQEVGDKDAKCTPSKTKKVGVLFFTSTVGADIALIQKRMKTSAEKYGMDLSIQDGKNDVSTMISVVRTFIAQNVDAIVVYPPDSTSLAPVLNEAGDAGIPIFALNLIQKDVPSLVTFVGPDDVKFGEEQAEILKKNFPDGANIGLLMGTIGTSAQIGRTKGLEDFVKKNPKYKIVAQQPDDWDPTKSLSITRDWLTKFPKGKLDVIIAQGPHPLTSIDNARQRGRDEIQWIFGDYLETTVPLLKDGSVLGTVFQNITLQADEITRVTNDWLTCNRDAVKTPADYTELTIIDKANADSYKPEF